MKRIAILVSILLVVGLGSGCGKKRVSLNPGVANNIAVLILDGNLKDQTMDQQRELNLVLRWMERDLIKNLKSSGFQAVQIKKRKDYGPNLGKLLIVDVKDFNAGNRAARAFVGYGAGAASLDLKYSFLNEKGRSIEKWEDGVGSSKGGTYCAQTLNRNALEKIVGILNG